MEQHITAFKIIGLSIETTNQDAQSAKDLGALWGKFYADGISTKISNRLSDDIYAIYTDYESDYREKMTAIVGYRVHNLETIPDGLVGREFEGGKHKRFIAKGNMPEAIIATWQQIWEADKTLGRRYTADFEIYGEKSQNGADSEVEVFIAVD